MSNTKLVVKDFTKDQVIQDARDMYLKLAAQLPEVVEVNDDNVEFISNCILTLKKEVNKVNKQRLKYSAPLTELNRELIQDAKNITFPMDQILTRINGPMANYLLRKKREEEEAKRQEIADEKKRLLKEQEKAEAAAVKNEDPLAFETAVETETQITKLENKVVKGQSNVRSRLGTTFVTETWKWKLDPKLSPGDLLATIPEQYLQIDEAKIGRDIRGKNGVRKIPGLIIYLDANVGSR